MAGASQLGVDLVGVAPVDRRLGGAREEVGVVRGQRDRSARAHDLGLALDEHVLQTDLGDRPIASSDQQVSVVQESHAVNSLTEKSLDRSNSFEKGSLERNFNDISSLGSEDCHGVRSVYGTAVEHSSD